MSNNKKEHHIIPRNLTAMADIVVTGNPINSRPESGVDNCYPGLEFDQRNIDKRFFPGMEFEFHRSDGAVLRSVDDLDRFELFESDFNTQIYMTTLFGLFGLDATHCTRSLRNRGGLDVWREVHDLRQGLTMVIISHGPNPRFDLSPVINEINQAIQDSQYFILRDSNNKILYGVYVGQRASYIDENGVIDTEAYRPGELTQSLCIPWQYDFRDCGCWYWASNKPDVVSGEEGKPKNIDFMRDLRGSNRDEPDVANRSIRASRAMSYNQMMTNWESLAIVLDDQEGNSFQPEPAPIPMALFDRDKLTQVLRELATVEHALCVEYLYAHYSLSAPRQRPESNASNFLKHLYDSADAILNIAIDEMRHLRWANQALKLLEGESYIPEVGRAENISKRLQHQFNLRPLLPNVLQSFVAVEAPSKKETDGLDGMYVKILRSIHKNETDYEGISRELISLIKLIIDEGDDHFERFSNVQRSLSQVPISSWFRDSWGDQNDETFGQAREADSSQQRALQILSDLNYTVMLRTLEIAFASSSELVQKLINQARQAMYIMHDINHLLATGGATPLFSTIEQLDSSVAADVNKARNVIEGILQDLADVLVEDPALQLINRSRKTIDTIIENVWREPQTLAIRNTDIPTSSPDSK